MENDKYFTGSDNLKIDSFIQIPKVLFKNPKYNKLTLTSRLIYSLYLNRYNHTKYKDEIGPYIIFGDKELEEFLAITKSTCIRSKKQLVDNNLIHIKKTTGFNKIYIKNYRNPDVDEFYYEQDLESYSFYRFPRIFFDEEFDELSLNSKFLYTYYFDWMCLSQMNYVVDNYGRIYFSESEKDQEISLHLNKDTIRTAKKQLIAADLLIDYKDFSKTKNYYLLKLANYNHKQLINYNLLSNKEKNELIKRLSNLNSTLIQTPKINIRQLRKDADISVKEMINLLKNKNYIVSPQTYNRYEKGTRKCPKELYNEIVEILKTATKSEKSNLLSTNESHINGILTLDKDEKKPHKPKNETYKNDKKDINKKVDMQLHKVENITFRNANIESNINYTDNYNKLNYINSISIEDNITNTINSIKTSFKNLNELQKSMIIHSLNSLFQKNGFTLNNQYIDLNSLNNLFSIFDEIENKDVESYFLNVIERMSIYKDNFKSNNNITNCFLTFVLNDLIKGKNQILSYINPYTDWMNLWNDMPKETSTKLSNELDDDYFKILEKYD